MRLPTLPTLGLLSALLLTGCDLIYQSPEPHRPIRPVTTILRVEQFPSPVAVGDSVTVKVTVSDSLNSRLVFDFGCSSMGAAITARNRARFKAPSMPGRYYCHITVDDPQKRDLDDVRAVKGYDVIVVARPDPN